MFLNPILCTSLFYHCLHVLINWFALHISEPYSFRDPIVDHHVQFMNNKLVLLWLLANKSLSIIYCFIGKHMIQIWWLMQFTKPKTEDSLGQEYETSLSYLVDVKPKIWLPVHLIEGRICKEIKSNLTCIREEAQKMIGDALQDQKSYWHNQIISSVRAVYFVDDIVWWIVVEQIIQFTCIPPSSETTIICLKSHPVGLTSRSLIRSTCILLTKKPNYIRFVWQYWETLDSRFCSSCANCWYFSALPCASSCGYPKSSNSYSFIPLTIKKFLWDVTLKWIHGFNFIKRVSHRPQSKVNKMLNVKWKVRIKCPRGWSQVA